MNFSAADPIGYSLYMRYMDEHPCWTFIAFALAFCIIGTIGIASNGAVIYVTIKTKKLHGTTFVLLALTSAFELVHLCGQYLFLYVALSGQNFIEYQLAVQICAPSVFAVELISPIMLFIGIDRLISVTFVNFYKTVKLVPYIGGMLFISALHSALVIYPIFTIAYTMPTMKTTGFIGDLFQGDLVKQMLQIGLYLNIATIFVYIVTGLKIRTQLTANSTTSDQSNKRIFNSICLIVFFNVGGYFVQKCVRLIIVPAFISSPITVWFVLLIAGIPLMISASSNAFILYFSSSKYRNAFCEEWTKLRSIIGIGQSLNNHHTNNNVQIILPMTTVKRINANIVPFQIQQRM
ncbi:hypothetical protein niasHT_034898 [Heterodera trifolii]|uniref:G_PROTEIN_RECEP_F1_2 domain-containing protein n=1 Tax=Heterodera trifolii TaxID=157864 RepID=A0ABD2IAS7_9BILA